jgi:hypothetical protein
MPKEVILSWPEYQSLVAAQGDDAPDYRAILLKLIGSLALCDHMGDVASDVQAALTQIGLDIKWDDLSDLGKKLGEMGVTTLYDTSLADEE